MMTKAEQDLMAKRIKKRRESLGFTQEQFAEVIELASNSYTKIENSIQKPGLDTLAKIAKNLNISLDYLVFGDPMPMSAEKEGMLHATLELADVEKLTHARNVMNQLIKIKEG